MMYHSPFFNDPFRLRGPNTYNRYHTPYPPRPIYHETQNISHNPSSNMVKEKIEVEKEETEKEIFELFGIKLYFDDILLICLLFFLYKEGVKDQYLFISLVLLLLS